MEWGPAHHSWIVIRIRNREDVDTNEADWAIRMGYAVRVGDEVVLTEAGDRFAEGK